MDMVKREIVLLLFLILASLNAAIIERGWESIFGDSHSTTLPIHTFGNKSYLVVTNYKVSFLQAMDFCENIHMNLVTIESEEEQKTIQKLIENGNVGDEYWTSGAKILDGESWLWLTTGDVIGYTAWASGESNPDSEFCLSIKTVQDLKSWYDLDCYKELSFICERPIDEKRVDIFAEEEKDWQNILNVHQRSPNLDLLHFNNKDYYISHDYKGSYSEALDYCQFLNMNLVTINSKEENDALYKHIRDTNAGTEFWTAGTRLLDGEIWVWLHNFFPITYTNWGSNQLNNSNEFCLNVYLKQNSGLFWSNTNCETSLKVICERNSDILHRHNGHGNDNENEVNDMNGEDFESNLEKMTPGQIQTVIQDGRKFHVSRNLLATPSEARAFCSHHNMTLINVGNAEENTIIANILPYPVGDEPFWTDGEKVDDKWVWKSTDTSITYFNWRQGSPQGEICLGITNYAKYVDESCSKKGPFICESVNNGTDTKKDNGDAIINVLMENNLITENGKVTKSKELVSSQNIQVNPNGGYHITVDNNAAKC